MEFCDYFYGGNEGVEKGWFSSVFVRFLGRTGEELGIFFEHV